MGIPHHMSNFVLTDIPFKKAHQGWGEDLVGKALTVQVWGPEFEPPEPTHLEVAVVVQSVDSMFLR